MTFHHVSVALRPNASAGFVLASCDTSADSFQPTEVTFEGVMYAAIGQAELDYQTMASWWATSVRRVTTACV